jgi:Methyltransferase domain
MDIATIAAKKQAIIDQFGAWTAHNIHLGGDLYTLENAVVGDEVKLRRILQMVADVARCPLSSLRVLDLACLEGLYAIEFARQGATVVGIEGRAASLEKARFAGQTLGLNQLEFYQDDVRNLSSMKYGRFDVVLCLGILYHLDMPDAILFLEQIAAVCQGFAIIDTHIGLPQKSYSHNGHTYWGQNYIEHNPASTAAERQQNLWASLDNPDSFWFTRTALLNALSHVGFTSVYECWMPAEHDKPSDRLTLIALKGQPQALRCAPLLNDQPIEDLPEPRQLE